MLLAAKARQLNLRACAGRRLARAPGVRPTNAAVRPSGKAGSGTPLSSAASTGMGSKRSQGLARTSSLARNFNPDNDKVRRSCPAGRGMCFSCTAEPCAAGARGTQRLAASWPSPAWRPGCAPARPQVIHFMRHGVTEMNMYLASHDHTDEEFEDPLL
jgi:hypothetical protein